MLIPLGNVLLHSNWFCTHLLLVFRVLSIFLEHLGYSPNFFYFLFQSLLFSSIYIVLCCIFVLALLSQHVHNVLNLIIIMTIIIKKYDVLQISLHSYRISRKLCFSTTKIWFRFINFPSSPHRHTWWYAVYIWLDNSTHSEAECSWWWNAMLLFSHPSIIKHKTNKTDFLHTWTWIPCIMTTTPCSCANGTCAGHRGRILLLGPILNHKNPQHTCTCTSFFIYFPKADPTCIYFPHFSGVLHCLPISPSLMYSA